MAGLRAAAAAGAAPAVAVQLLGLFDQAARQADRLQWVARQIATDLPEDGDEALARACNAVAAAIDAQPAVFDRLGYHNRQHFSEVALTAYALCLLARPGAAATQLVVLAALLHDVVHEGRSQPAFSQERASVETLRPLLEAAGLGTAQIGRLLVLVLATDPSSGTAYMAAARSGAAPPAPAAAPELAALAADPELARLAGLLCEADVLPSIGLDAAHAMRVQQRLAREWQRPLGTADKLAFIDHVLRQGYIGAFFLPCVQATRAALASGAHAVAQR